MAVAMRDDPEIAVQAIKTVYDLWSVDSDCVEWVGDATPDAILNRGYGFDWWPGDFKVAVRVSGPHPEIEEPVYRLSIRTDFLRGADATTTEFVKGLTTLNIWAPTFAICAFPTWMSDLVAKYNASDVLDLKSSPVWLASSAYLHRSTGDWLPRTLAGLSILQPIESQSQRLDNSVQLLGGTADRSSHPLRGPRTALDGVLGVEIDIGQHGKMKSNWAGSDEFQGIIDRWGRTETTFGMADENGLFIETPFGDDTAFLRLAADQPHPRLGSGLLAQLSIPMGSGPEETAATCVSLNHAEFQMWSKPGFPFIGNWCAREAQNAQGAYYYTPSFRCFIPNMMYQQGLAENIALYMIARARWARQTLLPDIVDGSMEAILSQRLKTLRPG